MSDLPFEGYPRDHLVGIVDNEAAATKLAAELNLQGVTDVQILSGEEGAEMLDSDGSEHGLFGRLLRTVERMSAEIDHLREYERAVREGSAVVVALAKEEPLRETATEIFRKHDARFVNYFGSMTVELVVR
jgi:hypothetical protein